MTNPHLLTPSGKRRARGLNITFDGTPGRYNSITDLQGVSVGYATIIEGDGALRVGRGPVRTGVTVILPRPQSDVETPVWAGIFSLNGNGEMTGSHWVEEVGRCRWPLAITNTNSCGEVRDAVLKWMVRENPALLDDTFALPVVGETYDGWLNDINGFHVKPEHVYAAIEHAKEGWIDEGSVGGGTGMICYGYKGGNGTASRIVSYANTKYTVGVFVQSNFGARDELLISGAPVGRHLSKRNEPPRDGGSSIIAIVGTDAPLLPHQLKRLARRVTHGIARTGSVTHHSSGDIFLAFSTANADAARTYSGMGKLDYIPDRELDCFFTAVVQATEEAIVNSVCANHAMTGRDGNVCDALPTSDVAMIMKRYARISPDANPDDAPEVIEKRLAEVSVELADLKERHEEVVTQLEQVQQQLSESDEAPPAMSSEM